VQNIEKLQSLRPLLPAAKPQVVVYAKSHVDWGIITELRNYDQNIMPLGLIILAPVYSFEDEKKAFETLVDHYMLAATPTESIARRVLSLSQKIENRRAMFVKATEQSRLPGGTSVPELHLADQHFKALPNLIMLNGEPIALSPIQFRLLSLFISRPGEVFERDELIRLVWRGQKISHRSIDAQVSKLKSRLPVLKKYITNVYGHGYSLNMSEKKKAS
jgi:DNA-binding response OmpR family regulator